MGKSTILRNIGALVSGDLEKPLLDADAIASGDIPGISMVMIDGAVLVERSRNTPPARRVAKIVGQEALKAAGH